VTCLNPVWQGHDALYDFTCPQGHAWRRTGKNAMRHPGCPQCSHAKHAVRLRITDGLARLQHVAALRGGVCLADDYAGGQHRYPFRCGEGHTWEAKGCDVVRRTWCPTCAIARKVQDYRHADGLEQLQAKVHAQSGACLSPTYEGAATRYRFRCAAGHEWETLGSRVLRGNWCFICGHEKRRISIEEAQQAAKARGGECLSDRHLGGTGHLRWRCQRGHEWLGD